MTNDDLNQIRGVVKEEIGSALKSIKGTLANHAKKLDILWDQTVKLSEDMIQVQETLDSHTKILDSHTISLKRIEENTEQNTNNLKKLNKRVGQREDQAGIVPLPELIIAE